MQLPFLYYSKSCLCGIIIIIVMASVRRLWCNRIQFTQVLGTNHLSLLLVLLWFGKEVYLEVENKVEMGGKPRTWTVIQVILLDKTS